MNSHVESEQLVLKEENLLPITELKIEPQDIKCENILESEDYSEFFEYVDIKHENKQSLTYVASIESMLEVNHVESDPIKTEELNVDDVSEQKTWTCKLCRMSFFEYNAVEMESS
ncbi:hypothetical protein L9F63_005512, partial [Diploptera punctata]